MKNHDSGFVYLGRFVFNGKESEGHVTFDIDGINTNTSLLFYNRQNVDWETIYKNRDKCSTMTANENVTKIYRKSNGEFTLEKLPSPSYWYIGIANCQDKFTVKGNVHLEDMEWTSDKKTYNQEFDYSQQSELEMTAFFVMLFGFLFIQFLYNFFLKMRPHRHMFIGLITLAAGFFAVGYVIRLIWATEYSQKGYGYGWQRTSDIFIYIGQMLEILVALLVADGYLIATPVMQNKILLFVIYGLTCASLLALFIYQCVVEDLPVAYTYLETVTGIIYQVFRAVTLGFFIYAITITRKQETYDERRSLFLILGIFYGCFIVGPIAGCVFGLCYPNFFRESFEFLMTRVLDFIGVVTTVYLCAPQQIEETFRVQGIDGNTNTEDSKPAIEAPVKEQEVVEKHLEEW